MSSHVVRALGEWRSATRCLGRVIMLRERALASRSRSEPDAARVARLERIERAVREVEAEARRIYDLAQREAIETARAGDATSSTLADVQMAPASEDPARS